MQPILIKRSRADLIRQFDFLKKFENSKYLQTYKPWILNILGLTILEFIFFFFTDKDNFVTLKAITFSLICLIWVIASIYSTWFFLTRIKRRDNKIKSVINTSLTDRTEYYISFDQDKLVISSAASKTEMEWSYFKGYMENNSSIFLFPEGSIYSCYSFSSEEIGQQNVDNLKNISKSKLPLLRVQFNGITKYFVSVTKADIA